MYNKKIIITLHKNISKQSSDYLVRFLKGLLIVKIMLITLEKLSEELKIKGLTHLELQLCIKEILYGRDSKKLSNVIKNLKIHYNHLIIACYAWDGIMYVKARDNEKEERLYSLGPVPREFKDETTNRVVEFNSKK